MQCQTIVDLVRVVQVFPYRVDDKPNEIRVFVHEQRQGEIPLEVVSMPLPPLLSLLRIANQIFTHDLLLAVFRTADQVDSLHVPNVDLVTQYIGEYHLGEVLFLLIPVKVSIFEFLPYVSHLPVDPLLLELADPTCSEIRDVLEEDASKSS